MSSIAQRDIYDIYRGGNLQVMRQENEDNSSIINESNSKGYLPHTLACYHGYYEAVSFLVYKVEDINANNNQVTALMAAVFKKDIELVKLLLDNNADPNIADANGTTAMHYATMFQNYDVISLLINAGADFTLKDNNGKTPIDFAKAYNDKKIYELLKLN